MGLKLFYKVLGIVLVVGAAFLWYRRIQGLDDETTHSTIVFCTIVGIACLFMGNYIDKLKK